MKNFLNILLISFSFANNLVVNFNYDQSYSSTFENDIRSNSIYEIVELNDTLWLRTGAGISFMKLDNQSMKFETIINSNLPEGGSPAFVINDIFSVVSQTLTVSPLLQNAWTVDSLSSNIQFLRSNWED